VDEWQRYLFGSVMAAIMVALAVYYAWREIRALKALKPAAEMPPDEHDFVRRKARRRLICSAFMLVLAGLLVGSFFLTEPAGHDEPVADAQIQKDLTRIYGVYWIVFLVVLLVIMSLAALDLFAIRRYGLTQHRKIQSDRRAMIEHQLARMRRERNGYQ
jgi:H+/Cl- antiporter ClcA